GHARRTRPQDRIAAVEGAGVDETDAVAGVAGGRHHTEDIGSGIAEGDLVAVGDRVRMTGETVECGVDGNIGSPSVDAAEHLRVIGVLVGEHDRTQAPVPHLGEEGVPVLSQLRARVDDHGRVVVLAGENVGVRPGQGHRAGIVRTDPHESSLSSSIVSSSSSSSPRDRNPGLRSVSCSPTAIALSRRVPLLCGSLPIWMTMFQAPSSRMASGRSGWTLRTCAMAAATVAASVRLSTMRRVLAPMLLGSPPTSSSTWAGRFRPPEVSFGDRKSTSWPKGTVAM